MGIDILADKVKEAVGETDLSIAIEQYELEYGKMTPDQNFIFRRGWYAGRLSLRGLVE